MSYKVVLIGESSVGKTCLINRYIKDRFDPNSTMTMGAFMSSKNIDIPGTDQKMKLQIWDTAGQEVYRSITQIYYRDAAAAICVFDTSDEKTLESAERWVKDLKEKAPQCMQIVLAGNKCDLLDKQQVSDE
jgi:Ras-related protein Rab-5C